VNNIRPLAVAAAVIDFFKNYIPYPIFVFINVGMVNSIKFIFSRALLVPLFAAFFCDLLYLTIDFLITHSLPSNVNNLRHCYFVVLALLFCCYFIVLFILFFAALCLPERFHSGGRGWVYYHSGILMVCPQNERGHSHKP
jgi:hypothetical protein